MSENVKDKVKQVLGLMGMPADESARLIYSWEAVPHTTSHPIERCYVRIPDEQVAKVADRIAELEVEIAQLKARFSNEWEDGWPEWSGWCWFQYTKPPLGYTDELPPTLAYIQSNKVELFWDHGTIKYKKLKKEFDGWQVRVIRIKRIRTSGKDWY